MDETLHYVHDECRCVTVRWTCRTLGISRPAAQALLEDVVLHEHNKRQCTYDIIRLETKVDEVAANFNENGTTVKKRTGACWSVLVLTFFTVVRVRSMSCMLQEG